MGRVRRGIRVRQFAVISVNVCRILGLVYATRRISVVGVRASAIRVRVLNGARSLGMDMHGRRARRSPITSRFATGSITTAMASSMKGCGIL